MVSPFREVCRLPCTRWGFGSVAHRGGSSQHGKLRRCLFERCDQWFDLGACARNSSSVALARYCSEAASRCYATVAWVHAIARMESWSRATCGSVIDRFLSPALTMNSYVSLSVMQLVFLHEREGTRRQHRMPPPLSVPREVHHRGSRDCGADPCGSSWGPHGRDVKGSN